MRTGSALLLALVLAFAPVAPARAGEAEDVAAALKIIEKMRLTGDAEGAAREAAGLVAKHPGSVDAHCALQDLQVSLGRGKETLDTYRAAAAAPDASADAHYLCARLLRGNPAAGEYRAALKADANHFPAMCGLAIELTRLKAYGEARTILDASAKLRPDSPVPLNAIGRIEEARGKTAEAERNYRAALELNPSMTVARVNLGVLLAATGRKEDGIKSLQDAATRAPKDPLPLLALGTVQLAAKDPKAAADSFRRAVSMDERCVASLNLLANAYIDLEMLDSAEISLQSAAKLDALDVTTKVNLAYVFVAGTKFDEALKQATAAVQLDDTCPEAHYLLGLIYDHQMQGKKADAEFRRAERLAPDDPVYVRAVAAYATSAADWPAAISEYQKLIKMSPKNTDAMMSLASVYICADKLRAAESTYDQIVSIEPGKLDAWLQLGLVAWNLKEKQRAMKSFREYVARGGKDPRVPGWIATLEKSK